MNILLPKEQTLQYELNYGPDRSPESDASQYDDISDRITTQKNTMSFEINSYEFLPASIKIDSYIPFLEKFTLTDYLYYTFGALTAVFGALKGLPYIINRLQRGRFRSKLHTYAKENESEQFDTLLAETKDKFLNNKITLEQYEKLTKTAKILKKLQKNTKKQELE